MFAGYWVVPWDVVGRLPIKPAGEMSLVALLMAARRRERVPDCIIVPGLDVLLGMAQGVESMAALVSTTLANAPTFQWRGCVIILPVATLRLNAEWLIHTGYPAHREIPVNLVLPRVSLAIVDDLELLHSPLSM